MYMAKTSKSVNEDAPSSRTRNAAFYQGMKIFILDVSVGAEFFMIHILGLHKYNVHQSML